MLRDVPNVRDSIVEAEELAESDGALSGVGFTVGKCLQEGRFAYAGRTVDCAEPPLEMNGRDVEQRPAANLRTEPPD